MRYMKSNKGNAAAAAYWIWTSPAAAANGLHKKILI